MAQKQVVNVSEADQHTFMAFLLVMEVLLNEKLVHSDMINGVVIASRPWGYTMSLWLRAGMHPEARSDLEAQLIEVSGNDRLKVLFKLHNEHQVPS